MKKITISILDFYQKIISSFLHQLLGINNACRFSITCSEYAKTQISTKGVVKGGYLAMVRLVKCQPFYKGE